MIFQYLLLVCFESFCQGMFGTPFFINFTSDLSSMLLSVMNTLDLVDHFCFRARIAISAYLS